MSCSNSHLLTRPSLLVRLRDHHDNEAWTTFVDLYGPVIYRWSRRRGVQDADAADLMQEVLAQVLRCIRDFEYQPERGRFRDWLCTVTRRELTRFFTRTAQPASRSAPAELDEMAAPLDAAWTEEFNAQVLRTALDRIRPHFEPATWQAFARVWLEGQSATATATEMQTPIEVIYVSKSRVLKRLQEEVLLLAEDLPQLVPLGASPW